MINSSSSGLPADGSCDPTQLPCPSWCQRPAGHPFHSITRDGLLLRAHMRVVSTSVEITADETAVADDGPVWLLSAPRLIVDLEPGDHLDARTARRIAAELVAGVDALERLIPSEGLAS